MIEDSGRGLMLDAAVRDAALARWEFDSARSWLTDASKGPMDPMSAEVWVLDRALEHVVLVRHRWRGWVCPGGRVEPGETPRAGAIRELREETGLTVDLLPEPAAVFVRSYHSDWTPTLGLAYAAITGREDPVAGESGQPAEWVALERGWLGAFPEDVSRIREFAGQLSGRIRDETV